MVVQNGGVFVIERGEAAQQDVEDDTKGPQIDALVIGLVLENCTGKRREKEE